MGRPSIYSPELADKILERLPLGQTEAEILKEEGMPSRSCLYSWRRTYREFQDAYVRARVQQHHAWADQIITLADDSSLDWCIAEDPPKRFRNIGDDKVVLKFDRTQVERAKLKIQAMQWIMANRKDSDYSPRQTITTARGGSYAGLSIEDLERELHLAAEQAGYRLVPLLNEVN